MRVKELFNSIQGEGPLAGMPVLFVRFAGCNLSCEWCDTDHEPPLLAERIGPLELYQLIRDTIGTDKRNTIVLTGGEPLIQPSHELLALIRILVECGFSVQIETNGSVRLSGLDLLAVYPEVMIVCSPKGPKLTGQMIENCIHWKFVLAEGEFPGEDVLDQIKGTIWIQPKDERDAEKNRNNTDWCQALVMEKGYRLSLQIHKILGMR